ncbi:unnamed protein product [Moneuplotes crassus]|uniref:rRNA methyltransferase 2, mitochondrial n=1 Tax=Euplotes crassus TaxID=5936 RepID=A0AAD1XDJ8_EUPCR|nr:unnamed protein product [Moneuplotes crassus]
MSSYGSPICFQRACFSSKMKKGGQKWMRRHTNDHFVKMARIQAYRSRASYKLLEIDMRHNLLKYGMTAIDIGASPGGWSQVLAEKLNETEEDKNVVACDLLPMNYLKGVTFIKGDITKDSIVEKISEALDFNKADLVCSDAVPDFIGEKYVDHISACDLNYMVLGSLKKLLKPGGQALVKVMRGPTINEVVEAYLNKFHSVVKVKPSASRAESNEMYILANGYDRSKQEFEVKKRENERKIKKIKTVKDLEDFEREIHDEGKEIAENILKDLKNKGQDITPGMKKALKDLGISEKELRVPPLTKASFLDKKKKQEKHEDELRENFEKKYGIKRKYKDMTEDEILEAKAKIEDELDHMTEEERRILAYQKIEYENEGQYSYPDEENPYVHQDETLNRINHRLKELEDEDLVKTANSPDEKLDRYVLENEAIRITEDKKEDREEVLENYRLEREEDRKIGQAQKKRKQSYYQRKAKREYKSQGFGVENNRMFDD